MKVAELEGEELDYWVAKAQGWALKEEDFDGVKIECWFKYDKTKYHEESVGGFQPSQYWGIGGPIIEKYRIAVYFDESALVTGTDPWVAGFNIEAEDGFVYTEYTQDPASISMKYAMLGATPLIAAMRAFVASVYGDEVPQA